MAADAANNALQQVADYMKQLSQQQNPIPFTTKFTGNHRDTLKWCHDVDMYLDTHLLQLDDQYAFRQIFKTLPSEIQSFYMLQIRAIKVNDNRNAAQVLEEKKQKMTPQALKEFIVRHYPPMQSRVDFIKRMKRIRVRRDEDPVIVWNRLVAMSTEVDSAIETINLSLPEGKKMAVISANDKFEICCSIFIHNNNKAHFQNNGEINAATVATITKEDPQSANDFKTIFATIQSKLIPKCRRGTRKFKPYPYTIQDFTATPSDDPKMPKDKKQHPRSQKNKRKSYDDRNKFVRSQKPKRQRKGKCTRCKHPGHHSSECTQHYDAHNNFIGTNMSIAHCTQCGRHNHLIHDCIANKHIDGTWLNNPNGQHGRKNNPNYNGSNQSKSKRGRGSGKHNPFRQYDQIQQQKPEIKTAKLLRQQSVQNAVMLLGQAISGDDSCNPMIQSQFKNLSEILNKDSNPRKS